MLPKTNHILDNIIPTIQIISLDASYEDNPFTQHLDSSLQNTQLKIKLPNKSLHKPGNGRFSGLD